MKIFSLLVFLLSFFSNSFAHNVVGGVYTIGADIEGEAGFSNGVMANAGTIVKVFDETGLPLGEVLTDDEGFFVFVAKKRITHVFEINMGAGHILKMQLPASELPESLGLNVASNLNVNQIVNTADKTIEKTNINTQPASIDATGNNQLDEKKLLALLEKTIAKQIIPLRKEIQALKEKSGFRDIIGGVGYIFGLLGLVAFLRERKLKVRQ